MPQRTANLAKVLNAFSLREASTEVMDAADIRAIVPLSAEMHQAYHDLICQRLHTLEGHAHDRILSEQERTRRAHYNRVALGTPPKGPRPEPGNPVVLLRPRGLGKSPEALGPYYLVAYPAELPGKALLRSGSLSDKEPVEWLVRQELIRPYRMRMRSTRCY